MVVVGTVKASDLFEVAWVSLVAGITVTILYALVVLFSARSTVARRSGKATAALSYGALALLTLCAFGALVIVGVQIMLSKG